MAPTGAARGYVGPGLDLMAPITRILCALLLTLSCTYSLPLRTDGDDYYMNGNIRCLRCHPGEFLKKACTVQDTRGECEPCPDGTYSEHPSGMPECLRCTRCRDDQEKVSSCSATMNTRCRCKKGTFCPPGQPCEICTPCTTSCPEDEVIQAPCNSTSDIMCAPPEDSTHARNVAITFSVLVPLLILILIVVVVYLKKSDACTGSRVINKLTVSFCKPEKSEEEDTNTQLLPRPRLEIKDGTSSDRKDEIISQSCVILVDKIPPNQFEKVMLRLGLRVNDVVRAKMDYQNTEDRHHAMLRMWFQQKTFNVNQLLDTLDSLNMSKAAHDITDQLLRDGLYIANTSS